MNRRWKRILIILLLVILLLPIATYIALKTNWGQSTARNYISRTLTKELGVDVSIGHIDFDPIKTLDLQDVLILDLHLDTLISAASVHADIGLFSLKKNAIHLSSLSVEDGLINLKKYSGEDKLDIAILVEDLSSGDSEREKWDFKLDELNLTDMELRHIDENKGMMDPSMLDPNHLILHSLSAKIDEVEFIDGGVRFRSHELSARERCGLEVAQLKAMVQVDDKAFAINEMMLSTRTSSLQGSLSIEYGRGVNEEIYLSTDLKESTVESSELGYFIKGYEDLFGEVQLDASIEGRLDDLVLSDATFRFGNDSELKLDGDIKGLPDIDSLWLNVHIHPLNSSVGDLHFLPVPGMSEQIHKLPQAADRLGRFSFAGHFLGYLEDFSADGFLTTELGSAEAKMDVKIYEEAESNSYKGNLQLNRLDIGSLLNNEQMGIINSDLKVDMSGHGNFMNAELQGLISRFDYKGYTYENIEVDGTLRDRLFNGFLSISQPEVDLDFRGLLDLRSSVPEFNFEAEVYQADIARLGFTTELDSTSMTGSVQADFKGDSFDEFEGSLKAQGLSFCQGEDEYFFSTISVLSTYADDQRRITVESNMLDAVLEGQFKVKDLKGDFISLFDQVFPSLYAGLELEETKGTQMSFDVQFKDTENLADLFVPGFDLGSGARMYGRLNTVDKSFKLNLKADSMNYDFIGIQGVDFEVNRSQDVAYAFLETAYMQWSDSLQFRDNFYTFNAYRDSVETDFTWTLVDRDASGSISLLSHINSLDSIVSVLYPSQMVLSGNYWLTEGFSEITYSNGNIHIDRAVLSNGPEKISLFGSIAKAKDSRLDFDVEGFQLEHINKFLPKDMVLLDGVTELSGYGNSLLGKPTVVADMEIGDFAIGGERIGNLSLSSTWDRGQDFLRLSGELENQGINEIEAEGRYYPTLEEDNLDAVLSFNGFYLDVLNKLPTGGISHLGGQASGNLVAKGTLLEPDINGELSFKDATMRVNYLNTSYFFNDKVIVRNDFIGTDHILFTDEYGNQGYLNGTVAHDNYRDWNYDIYAEFEKMLVMNTDASLNQTFYGKVFGSGSVSIFGFDRNLTIEIFGKTEEGTVLELPLGSGSDVVLEDFVYFKSEADETDGNEDNRPPTTIELFMEAEATPEAEIKLIFDEKIGDVMSGRGLGTLTMTLDRAGTFEIFGNYMVSEGDYLFTLQNVVNKRFVVEPGSMVSFYGDPYEAELDLKTIYKLRASIADLLGSDGLTSGSRVPVECQMDLDGALLNPDIGFGIEFPGLDPGTEALAQSKLDTEEELNRQVFSLLVLNKFLSSEVADASAGISAATTTINEFASSQLSNWLSQISDDVDVGVNYRAGDNITSEELAVALTTQLFNDRLLLTGNFGVQNTNSNSVERASSLIGDFRLEYILTKDGKLRLMVFNETNDYSFLNLDQAQTKQGVGLIFQREFDGLFDDTKN